MKVKGRIPKDAARSDGGMDTVSRLLYVIYFVFLALSVWIVVRIVRIRTRYTVDPKVAHLFRPVDRKVAEEPARGSIIAEDGRLLAISMPVYQVYMDCAVQRDIYRADAEHGAEREAAWQASARELAAGLAAVYGDRSAKGYADYILKMRGEGARYVRIGGPVDHETLQRVKALPLFREGPYKGGMIVERRNIRQYPYDKLARRTIGYVKDNSRSNGNNRIGIEGKFDHELHGREGYEWLRVTDDRHAVHNYDSAWVRAEDGLDVRTTLNIDFQDIADRAIRQQVAADHRVQGACAILLDVGTGAVRAMVNLQRATPDSPLEERFNLAIGQVAEQGSVFKTVTLMSLIEDGYVTSLEQTLPTNHGRIPGTDRDDPHIIDYERTTRRRDITVRHGFEISSNYVFTYLATTSYGSHPDDFFDRIYSYKLGEAFDFDIEGLGTPQVNRPGTPGWNSRTLGTTAYGYSISVTPLHIAAFYNAIANKGRMMKPYLVEDLEKDGVLKKRYGPAMLNSICSKATADTLTRALMAVTESGTGKRLKGAKATVAGKTGTARVVLSPAEHPLPKDAYHDQQGRMKNQGTFVGFFPAEDPQYTVLVTVYSFLSHSSFYGGNYPAAAALEIVDTIYSLSPEMTGKAPLRRTRKLKDAFSR